MNITASYNTGVSVILNKLKLEFQEQDPRYIALSNAINIVENSYKYRWHDAQSENPDKSGWYVVDFKDTGFELYPKCVEYDKERNLWMMGATGWIPVGHKTCNILKWKEIDR